jgi:hypothetical protein
VKGTFTTLKYQDGELLETLVCHNDFTNVGHTWMWQMMAGNLRDPTDGTLTDHLGAARIVVGNGPRMFMAGDERLDGPQTDQAGLDEGYPRVEGSVITFKSTFGERQAVFDWQERGVVTAQGVLIDRAVADQGRKVLGSVWVVVAELELARS